MTINGIKLEKGKYGLHAALVTAWSDEMLSFLEDSHVLELELNDGKGWRGNDITFLEKLPWLQVLQVTKLQLPSVESIHYLHELRVLDVITYCRTEIHFSAFPHLEECALEWRPKAKSLFDCITLKSLFVNRYKGKSTEPFGRLTNLESLAIYNAPIEDLQGLVPLSKLRSLRLANLRCLGSLTGLERLTALEELEIDTCRKIQTIDEIGCLSKLRKLQLDNCGDIESLKPLAKLTELELVGFVESTNILDGDLSPLLKQKKLSRVAFRDRKHYSHRWEEIDREG
jgi:Leucine-rich repeat (LRR) protein